MCWCESLKEVPITKGTFPCKLFEYMASGRPIVFGSRDGEAVNELEKAGGALAFPPMSRKNCASLILKLKSGQIDGERSGGSYLDMPNDSTAANSGRRNISKLSTTIYRPSTGRYLPFHPPGPILSVHNHTM